LAIPIEITKDFKINNLIDLLFFVVDLFNRVRLSATSGLALKRYTATNFTPEHPPT
jgi:hypothetical protein